MFIRVTDNEKLEHLISVMAIQRVTSSPIEEYNDADQVIATHDGVVIMMEDDAIAVPQSLDTIHNLILAAIQ